MNSTALVIAGTAGNDLSGILAFIDTQTKGQGGEDYEILDTFPILFVCSEKNVNPPEELTPYISEELTFVNGYNYAGQTLTEVLELLDTDDVHIGGSEDCPELSRTCSELTGSGFNVHML